MDADIEYATKNFSTYFNFPQMQSKEKIIHHEITHKPWKVLGTKMLSLHNKHYLCIVDDHSRLPIITMTEGFSADHLILAYKAIYAEYRLPKKIIINKGIKFLKNLIMTEKFSFGWEANHTPITFWVSA